MVNKSVVFGCTTGYAKNSDKRPTFTAPSDKNGIRKSVARRYRPETGH